MSHVMTETDIHGETYCLRESNGQDYRTLSDITSNLGEIVPGCTAEELGCVETNKMNVC